MKLLLYMNVKVLKFDGKSSLIYLYFLPSNEGHYILGRRPKLQVIKQVGSSIVTKTLTFILAFPSKYIFKYLTEIAYISI